MHTRLLAADDRGVAEAGRLLAAGRLVAFPTETVYGLGADARDGDAVAALYAAKGRPARNPLIVHVADAGAAGALGRLGAVGERLAAAFWPGPLTLVVPRRADDALAPATVAGGPSVGLRVPGHPVTRAVLAAAGCPVAAPSANPSGRISPTTAAHVADPVAGLGGRIDAVLDGGACGVGVESTILALDEDGLVLLRPGAVTAEAIAEVAGRSVETPGATPATGPLAAPGQLASHYAPVARLRLDAGGPAPGEGWLDFGATHPGAAPPAEDLSPAGDFDEAASRLFAALRRLDAAVGAGGTIAVARIPERGIGRAVNDRLRRAAAPRG